MMRDAVVAGEDWVEGSATVTSSRGSWSNYGDQSTSGLAKQVICFQYEVAGRRYAGKFEQFEPLEEGTALKLLYNPQRPGQNSLAEYPMPGWGRFVAIVLGLALAWLVHYLSERYGLEGKWTKY
jgi:hypothetical protein